MRRFLIDSAEFAGPELSIDGEAFHHMVKVLRLKEGVRIAISNGEGLERIGTIKSIGKTELILLLSDSSARVSPNPATPAITIFQGLPKGDKMEHIIQKCTELGAARIIPFAAERSVRKIRKERECDLLERWQKIAREAARQSGRASRPEIRFAANLPEALRNADQDMKLMLWEEERIVGLRQVIADSSKPERISVIIGPEGGMSGAEATAAKDSGFQQVTFGNRIVRTETAPLVVLSILQFVWGDIG